MAQAMNAKGRGMAPQDEQKQAVLLMQANADGTISLTFKGKPALLGDEKPYLGLASSALCNKSQDGAIESIGVLRLGEATALTENKNGTARLDFEDGRQLLLKPAGRKDGVAIVKPFGITLGVANGDVTGQLIIGDACILVTYPNDGYRRKTLENIASGKAKIQDFAAEKAGNGCKATLTTERGDVIILHISPKQKNGFSVIEHVEVNSRIF